MKKNVIALGVAGVLLVVAAFVAGALVGPSIVPALTGGTGFPGAAPAGAMRLSEEDRSKLQNMTDEERQAFMQERFGDRVRVGGPGGPRGVGIVEGEMLEVTKESFSLRTSNGGSQTFYLDDETLLAYAKGVDQVELAKGQQVRVTPEPEADGVVVAGTIIVK